MAVAEKRGSGEWASTRHSGPGGWHSPDERQPLPMSGQRATPPGHWATVPAGPHRRRQPSAGADAADRLRPPRAVIRRGCLLPLHWPGGVAVPRMTLGTPSSSS
jgi:hypothetical protein